MIDSLSNQAIFLDSTKAMRRLLFINFILFFLVGCDSKVSPLFEKVSSEYSELNFTNQVFESDSLNLAYNYYFYNGAGVTTCDFNQDGLLDVLMIGNHVPSRLYLNQGNLQFKDITEQAGLLFDHWASGATFADVNGDKLQDIFISTVGKDDPNLLFINQGINELGIPTFKEKAEEYGLGAKLISTQAAFFDYDKDNDLDLFIAVNSQLMNNRNETRARNLDEYNYTQDKFYRNNGDDTFTDISAEAGIINEGYSLGLAINDLNNDGWPDIYVANDFISNDLIYINNQEGGFEEKAASYLRHASQNGMGVDIADINHDGLMDITVVDMMPKSNRRRKLMMSPLNYDLYEYRLSLGYIPQHVRNTIQLNNGAGRNGEYNFSEIGCLTGIYSTDWSWAPLWADFDNDGHLDLFITNGYYKDLTDLDFSLGLNNHFGTDSYNKEKQLKDLANLRPIKENNFFYKNNGELKLEDVSKQVGIDEPSFSHGSAFADLDNDGDLDLIINNLGQKAFLYKNKTIENQKDKTTNNYLKINLKGLGKNTNAIGTRLKLVSNGVTQTYYHSNLRGYLSSMGSTVHFGLGAATKVDSLIIYWPDGTYQSKYNISANQELIMLQQLARPKYAEIAPPQKRLFADQTKALNLNFTHQENKFTDFKDNPLFLKMYSKEGPAMAVGDVNSDGQDDVIVGGAKGKPTTLFIQKEGRFQQENILVADSIYEDMGILLFDVDNDNDQDLYIVSGGMANAAQPHFFQDRLYLNENGQFIKSTNLPKMTTSGGVVRGADYDRDGDIDLFVGGKISPKQYPKSPKSYLLTNENGQLKDETPDDLAELGMISDALWTDFNGDGWIDLIVVGEWMPITFIENQQGQLKIENSIPMLSEENSTGWWNSIAGGDFDNDGDIDYLLGNLGLNTHLNAAPEQPIRMYVGDFDENDKIDPILSYYSNDDSGELKEFPVHTRDALIDQIVGYKRRFKNYKSFAEAKFESVLKKHDRKDTEVLETTILTSSYLENLGNGQFDLRAMPLSCQVAPVYGISVSDINKDGHLDALLTGNQNSAEPLFGNLDASNGIYLIGDGKGNLTPIPTTESGLTLNEDQKSIVSLYVNNHPILLTGANSGKIKALTPQPVSPVAAFEIIPLQTLDTWMEITFKNGTTTKRELPYGNTYLSQSSRKVSLTKDMEKVVIYNSKGESRVVRG